MILLGIILLALAAYDQYTGTASATGFGPGGATQFAKKAEQPDTFQRIVAYEWLRGSLIVCAGLFILWRCDAADRSDPFSPKFRGNAELDELGRKLDEEKRKR
jgi:hypothetical protein